MVTVRLAPLLTTLAVFCYLAGCKPDLEGGASIVDSARVLAIRSEPAEAAPKGNPATTVSWSALFVDKDGDADPAALDWALCTERKPLATAGEISLDCLAPSGDALIELGGGSAVSGSLPDDGCRLFGPNPPLPKPGEPAPRPTDPDATGGFYQPLRLLAATGGDEQYSVGLTRIFCGIARVSADQTFDFQKRYRQNENPKLEGLVVGPERDDAPVTNDEGTATVRPGSHVKLRASWTDCPLEPSCGDGICGAAEDKSSCPEDCMEPHGCTGSEPYVAFDLASRTLLDRREAMRVSWYANAGAFDHDRSGRTESDASVPNSDNGWVAPSHAGDVRIWVVLRDDRGGVDYASYLLHVE
jgi:hypothetical protein